MTDLYSPPTSSVSVASATPRRTLRCIVGFLSGVLSVPVLLGLMLLPMLLAPDTTGIRFTQEDLPHLSGVVLLVANGALCALLAARFPRYPLWLAVASGFALPVVLFLGSAVFFILRLAA